MFVRIGIFRWCRWRVQFGWHCGVHDVRILVECGTFWGEPEESMHASAWHYTQWTIYGSQLRAPMCSAWMWHHVSVCFHLSTTHSHLLHIHKIFSTFFWLHSSSWLGGGWPLCVGHCCHLSSWKLCGVGGRGACGDGSQGMWQRQSRRVVWNRVG